MQRNLPSAFNKQTQKKESLLQQQQQRHRFLLACIQRDCTTSDSKQSPEWDCSFLATFLAPPSLPPPPTLFLFWLYLWLFPFLPPTTHPSLSLSWLTFFSSLSLFTLFLIVLPCCRDRAVTLTQFQKRGNNIVLQRIRTWNFICVSLFFFKFIVILELHLITSDEQLFLFLWPNSTPSTEEAFTLRQPRLFLCQGKKNRGDWRRAWLFFPQAICLYSLEWLYPFRNHAR